MPSGCPIRSSWAMNPRWVWKSFPATSSIVWWRPLGSVSWTRSPARNGPRRCSTSVIAGSAGGGSHSPQPGRLQRADDVDASEYADDGLRLVDDQILRRRMGLDRLEE